jgi:hypothetical protein
MEGFAISYGNARRKRRRKGGWGEGGHLNVHGVGGNVLAEELCKPARDFANSSPFDWSISTYMPPCQRVHGSARLENANPICNR